MAYKIINVARITLLNRSVLFKKKKKKKTYFVCREYYIREISKSFWIRIE